MEEIKVNKGEHLYKLYMIGSWGDCCSDDPRPAPSVLTHPLAGGGMSSPQSITPTQMQYGDLNSPQHIVVERDACIDMVLLVMPGVSCDVKLDVRLAGEGAEANIYGAYVCGSQERVKISVDMHHDLPHCNSRQLFKGIAQDAQRTEAYQENHNILLTDGAKVDTKPQLEIYADDVKCSHGATIGRLNEEEQFYMRSRGISLEDAKVLQMISFIAPVLENIPEADRGAVAVQFEDAIRNIVRNS